MNLDLWQKKEYSGMLPGLGRISGFLDSIGNPQESFKAVHIAGTNGKGATARILSRILEKAGYCTGLYISPHLVRLNERLSINSKTIGTRELNALAARYEGRAKRYSLSFFEFITALCFIYFKDRKIDIAVLETGLGGRFDATNVIKHPLAAIITEIGLEHGEILGKSLKRIAFEKAGIIKRGITVISAVSNEEPERVIKAIARKKNCDFYRIGKDFDYSVKDIYWNKGFQSFEYKNIRADSSKTFKLSLIGDYQARNAAVALFCSDVLKTKGFDVPEAAKRKALANVAWPGRFDVRSLTANCAVRTKNSVVVIDGAHNPQAMRSFIDTWRKSPWAKHERAFVFGALKDKDYWSCLRILAPYASRLVLTRTANARSIAPRILGDFAKNSLGLKAVETADSIEEAAGKLKKERVFVVTGSLYLAGETIKYLDLLKKRRMSWKSV
jgi:dihydrofolate synthase / folylpolyglutamate synthase